MAIPPKMRELEERPLCLKIELKNFIFSVVANILRIKMLFYSIKMSPLIYQYTCQFQSICYCIKICLPSSCQLNPYKYIG